MLGDPPDVVAAELHVHAAHWHSHLFADGSGAGKAQKVTGLCLHLGSPGGC